jgi:hypothetical protein
MKGGREFKEIYVVIERLELRRQLSKRSERSKVIVDVLHAGSSMSKQRRI